jgi:aryl-alcohol dehydrogenase-like predicted oxidoreductase
MGLGQPGITSPIIGATKLNYLDDAVAALDLKLEEAELRSLIEPYRPRGVLANL